MPGPLPGATAATGSLPAVSLSAFHGKLNLKPEAWDTADCGRPGVPLASAPVSCEGMPA